MVHGVNAEAKSIIRETSFADNGEAFGD